jgi:hypothetical protein
MGHDQNLVVFDYLTLTARLVLMPERAELPRLQPLDFAAALPA